MLRHHLAADPRAEAPASVDCIQDTADIGKVLMEAFESKSPISCRRHALARRGHDLPRFRKAMLSIRTRASADSAPEMGTCRILEPIYE